MIRISHLSKAFYNNVVLDDVSADIEKGDVVALIGSSGAGKSTFLRAVNCLEKADRGKIDLEGLQVDFSKITKKEKLTLRRETAMVFQQFNLFLHRTALENIKEGLKVVKKLIREKSSNRELPKRCFIIPEIREPRNFSAVTIALNRRSLQFKRPPRPK